MLTVREVKAASKPGMYSDGPGRHGLHLRVAPGGSKQWVQRLWFNGRQMNVGLGPVEYVSLAKARRMAAKNHLRTRGKGKPPKSYRERRGLQIRKAHTAAKGAPTFAKAAEETIVALMPAWKNPEPVAKQWRQQFGDYAYPVYGHKLVADISTADILAAIEPIWKDKRATANDVLRRTLRVLRRAKVQGHRQDTIEVKEVTEGLPKNGHKTNHQAALPHGEVGAALAAIAKAGAMLSARLAVRFQALTAARPSEARLAQWAEIDLEGAVWVIPATRMKAGREHRVPLSTQALAVLAKAKEYYGDTGLVFPGKGGKAMARKSMGRLVQPYEATNHGFRSSFTDWAAETGVVREVAEDCLAHLDASKVRRAYKRGDLLDQRRPIMQAWGDYIAP